MKIDTTSQDFFDEKYRREADPWNFADNPYELDRYQRIVDAITQRRYRRGFEPACSIGVLTQKLAPYCDELEAMDISPTAVAQAQTRCADLANVRVRVGRLPEDLPDGEFDLIVFSEVGYYLSEKALRRLGGSLASRLESDGVLVAAHWLGYSEEHVLTGDRVHEILEELAGMRLEQRERHDGYRLDVFVKANR